MTPPREPRTGPFVAFKRHVRAEAVPGEAAFVLSDQGVTVLRGAGIESLVPLLDGSHTLDALLRAASATMPVAEVGRALRSLAQANLVGYRHGGADPAGAEPAGGDTALAQAYWDRAGLDGYEATAEVRTAPVAVIPVGGVNAAEVRAACEASGLNAVDEDADAPLALVVCADYLDPGLRSVSRRLRRQGRTWLLARPFGADPWTGPFFSPATDGPDGPDGSDGPCWSCLAHRLSEHRAGELPVQRALGLDGPAPRPAPTLSAVRSLGLQCAVLELSKWLAGLRYPEQRSVCVLDSLNLSTAHHTVLRRPQCLDCGDPSLVARRTARPLALASRPKAEGTGSNDRAVCAEGILIENRHLISPVTGIVTNVRPVPGLPDGLHAYDSGHNLALRGHSLAGVHQVLRARSGGKGATATEARASALCEAAERYSAARQGDELVIRESMAGLGAAAVHPNTYQLFDERQYADRARWNALQSPFHRVSRPFDPAAETEWTPVWSLTAGAHRMLPTSTLYFDTGTGASRDGLWADSNGNAAGGSLEDAVVQGVLELVERDAVALWWYNRLSLPGLDLDSFDEPWLAATRSALDRAGHQVWALDLTTDLGIPVVAAVSRRTGGPAEEFVYGFGAHLDPRLALRRAVTEMVQMLPAPGGSGTALPGQPQLFADPAQTGRTPASWRYAGRNADLLDDVTHLRTLLESHGMELLVLDQTRPDVGIPVVKTLVPGLRPFYARFAPGRLFDVPVRLGQRNTRTAFRELNGVPLPL
ncbi:TOMM precursor leader peptide-binding protein [Streptomyces sp. NBC_00347]|uniref:TOMM precursor leader peptide-binding protein n=1 Tax=Streptomyces sp. NBC_00347 TaxID=2975721 RepID=UPI002252EDEA|nr:TOMM precursor leader peptide-binding protein [Streptomyces sp. NBC_00347]MCX5130314.1 TOMM precursor leader peptide-binding protein [Streptomyces sp. NBC_00347]